MKRSRVNEIMAGAEEMIAAHGFKLPPFAWWSPEEFRRLAPGSRVAEARMGWDITDYGQEQFDELGLILFTLRNGRLSDLQRGGGMAYAEKFLISRQDQLSPMHTHVIKAEDIINRGGATLALELYNSRDDGSVDEETDVTVATDGMLRTRPAGAILRLQPGESVTLMPGNWHAFWGEGGDVLIGEVSTVNDDLTDNVFREPIGRFAEIEEDEPPRHLLVSDYDRWLG
jgi:D-lyxose ketol-isomerase